MSFVAFSFGSFGDIITLVQLVVAAIKALDDSRGSAKEYQRLSLYLASFSGALDAFKTEYTDASSQHQIEEPLRLAIEASYGLLLALNQEIRKYESRLRPGGSSNRIRDIMAKLVWIWKKREMEQLQRQLSAHVELVLLCSKSLDRKQIQRLQEHIDTRMEEHARVLSTLQSSIQGGPQSVEIEAIFLNTFLGHTIQVPFHCCTSYEAFHLFLQSCFQGWPCKAYVESHDYALTTGDTQQSSVSRVTESAWNSIRPGTLIQMSAILSSYQVQKAKLIFAEGTTCRQSGIPCEIDDDTRIIMARCMFREDPVFEAETSEHTEYNLSMSPALEVPMFCITAGSLHDLKKYEEVMSGRPSIFHTGPVGYMYYTLYKVTIEWRLSPWGRDDNKSEHKGSYINGYCIDECEKKVASKDLKDTALHAHGQGLRSRKYFRIRP